MAAPSAPPPAPRLHVLGTRGIPNRYGGFEAFAERLATWLAGRGWQVTVYCQDDSGRDWRVDSWRGVRLVHVPVAHGGASGSVAFDWKSARRADAEGGLLLTLGYNTAVFFALHRLAGRPHVVNMGGLDWKRPKWSPPVRAWFYANAWLAGWLATALVADHPEVERRLRRRFGTAPITMIPYGADAMAEADPAPLGALGLAPDRFGLVIARSEPENSILEIVRAWSSAPRGLPLVVLGDYDFDGNVYHRRVREAAGAEVVFPGAHYDPALVGALRVHCRLYLHGHTVGGTNPSLVEALGAGSPALARDNVFNRWVARDAARYFSTEADCAREIDDLLHADADRAALRSAARARHAEAFDWSMILPKYEQLLRTLHG
jgi:glycosyltransferase involved in cell wall biosynthesis